MRVVFVTLLWRNESFVVPFARTLAATAAKAGMVVELVAVENGPDGAEAARILATELEQYDSISLKAVTEATNRGFAGGMNIACSAATGDVIVVANLDMEFDEDFVAALATHSEDLVGLCLLAPSVTSPSSRSGTIEAGAMRRDRLHRPATTLQAAGAGDKVGAGNGACIVFGRDLMTARYRAVGGLFDEEYHSYYEDVDIFWWAARNAIPVVFRPDVRVFHHQGGSFDGKYRFEDRTSDVRRSVMANYRLTVWKNAMKPVDVAGWLVGEGGYLVKCVRMGAASGVRTYVSSWVVSARRGMAIRSRRGSLRPSRVALTAGD